MLLSGDENVNRAVAENRNIDFHFARGRNKKIFREIMYALQLFSR